MVFECCPQDLIKSSYPWAKCDGSSKKGKSIFRRSVLYFHFRISLTKTQRKLAAPRTLDSTENTKCNDGDAETRC